jgi:hypothetical protein
MHGLSILQHVLSLFIRLFRILQKDCKLVSGPSIFTHEIARNVGCIFVKFSVEEVCENLRSQVSFRSYIYYADIT